MTKALLIITLCIYSSLTLIAGEPEDSLKIFQARIDSIESNLHYKTGKISLPGAKATINVPANFKFLDAEETKYVLQDLWGNPPGSNALGMIFPASSGAMDPGSYAFVIQYEEMGYVKDGDADKINYDDLLKEEKESSDKDNVERKQMGLSTMYLVGWASKPFYDKEKKVLHWAKEFKVDDSEENTLNYDVRVLGRKGVLILKAVSGMSQLDSVNRHINDVLGMVKYDDGNRYADFDSKTDNVAAWTVGGLVAGKVLAKVGFFAVIMKFLKFILVGIALAGGAIWRFITGKRKKEQEFVYQPQPAPSNDETSSPVS